MRRVVYFCLAAVFVLGIQSAAADSSSSSEESSSSSSSSSSVSACVSLQDCVDNSVPVAVTECSTSNPECVVTNADKYAATAGQIADRAVARKRCNTKTFRKRGACNGCYQAAKEPLKDRFFGALFHGLLANATSIIDQQRRERCNALPK